MNIWQVFHIFRLLCCIWMPVYFALAQDDGDSWIVAQYEGLDDLYIEIRKSVALETKSMAVQDACDGIKRANSFNLQTSNFRSKILEQILDIDSVPPDENGYRRYVVNDLEVYLYTCNQAEQSKKYFLTHAYEYDNLFFLFVYDYNTQEMALEALVEEEVDTLREDPTKDIGDFEMSYIMRRESYYEHFHKKYPDNENPNDLIGDPVCALNVPQRVRLCALVLNTPYFKAKYAFVPSPENVDPVCGVTRLVLLGLDYGNTECTYRCYVADANVKKAIYVSRSYRNYQVFVFEAVPNDENAEIAQLENIVGNLAFIEEREYVTEMDSLPEESERVNDGNVSPTFYRGSGNHNPEDVDGLVGK